MVRHSVFLSLVLSGVAVAEDPSTLSGSWSVTGKLSGGVACGKKADKVIAYQWIVTVQPTGETSIKVQGDDLFPTLTGKTDGTRMEVRKHAGSGLAAWLSHFDVTFSGDKVSGTRTEIATNYGDISHCTWTVSGKRL